MPFYIKILNIVVCVLYTRNLEKAESRMAKLSKGLSEVDIKVENLRKTFEKTTTEAAKMKVELDQANETILAADNLVGKLEGEYQRWSGQVSYRISFWLI